MARSRRWRRLFGKEIRDTDLLGHPDKGTLAVVLLDADFEHAASVIDRLIARVESYDFQTTLRISVGAACYPTHANDVDVTEAGGERAAGRELARGARASAEQNWGRTS